MTLRWVSALSLVLGLSTAGPADAALRTCTAANVAGRYTHALVAHNFRAMWTMLSPTARAAWDDNAAVFTHYVAAKFTRLHSVSPAMVSGRSGTGGRGEIAVHLRWRGPADAAGGDGQLLLDGYPLRVGPAGNGGCEVVDAGFTGPGTPLVVPDQAAVTTARVPILMYHNVSLDGGSAGSLLYGLTVRDGDFGRQLAYLRAHGYHTITLVRLFEYFYYGRPLPPRPIILSFDDGYDNAYTDAFPLLRQYGAVGVFNVITGKVGLRHDGVNSYATWAQLAEMHRAGMEIESHTVYHEDLGLVAPGEARNEIRFARTHLRMRLGVPAQFLTYPAGEPFRSGTPDAQARVLRMVAAAGYVGALLDQRISSSLQDALHPYQLPRIRVDGGESLAAFAASLTPQRVSLNLFVTAGRGQKAAEQSSPVRRTTSTSAATSPSVAP